MKLPKTCEWVEDYLEPSLIDISRNQFRSFDLLVGVQEFFFVCLLCKLHSADKYHRIQDDSHRRWRSIWLLFTGKACKYFRRRATHWLRFASYEFPSATNKTMICAMKTIHDSLFRTSHCTVSRVCTYPTRIMIIWMTDDYEPRCNFTDIFLRMATVSLAGWRPNLWSSSLLLASKAFHSAQIIS